MSNLKSSKRVLLPNSNDARIIGQDVRSFRVSLVMYVRLGI